MELTKFAFRGELIASISYIKKAEKSKINILPFIRQEKEKLYPKKTKERKNLRKNKLRKKKQEQK